MTGLTGCFSTDPLTCAIVEGNVDHVRQLLWQKNNDEQHSSSSSSSCSTLNETLPGSPYTPLLLAIQSGVPMALLRELIETGGADIGHAGPAGVTPLLAACHLENLQVVDLLLQMNQDTAGAAAASNSGDIINACSVGTRRTPLMVAASKGHVPLTQMLLNAGADQGLYDEQAKNALMYACSEQHLEIVQLLLSWDEQLREGESNYATTTTMGASGRLATTTRKSLVNEYKVDPALWYACAAGNADIVLLLLQTGAEIEYRKHDATIYSTTPLMEAAEWGHLPVVKLLLRHGANPCNKTGRKALKMAHELGYHSVVDELQVWQKRLRNVQGFLENQGEQEEGGGSTTTTTTTSTPLSLWPRVMERMEQRTCDVQVLLHNMLERPDMISHLASFSSSERNDE